MGTVYQIYILWHTGSLMYLHRQTHGMGTAYQDFTDTLAQGSTCYTHIHVRLYIGTILGWGQCIHVTLGWSQDGNRILKDGAASVSLVTVLPWVVYDKYVYAILGLSTVSLGMDVIMRVWRLVALTHDLTCTPYNLGTSGFHTGFFGWGVGVGMSNHAWK